LPGGTAHNLAFGPLGADGAPVFRERGDKVRIKPFIARYRFINDVLLFAIMVAGIALFIISQATPRRSPAPPPRPSLPVVPRTDPSAKTVSIELAPRPVVLNDYLVFPMTDNKLVENAYPNYGPSGDGAPRGQGAGPGPVQQRRTVNLLFVKNDGSQTRTLFKQNCLIVMQTYAGNAPYLNPANPSYGPKTISKNVYLAVTGDTNNNGTFDFSDRKDLFVSNYDGTELKEVLQSVGWYQGIGDDKLLILQDDSQGATQYYSYDLSDGSLKQLINTKDLTYSSEGSK